MEVGGAIEAEDAAETGGAVEVGGAAEAGDPIGVEGVAGAGDPMGVEGTAGSGVFRPASGVPVVECGAVGREDPPVTGAGRSPARPEEVGVVEVGTVVGDCIGGFCSGVTRVVPGRADFGGVEGVSPIHI
ncbi:hypothetical protein DF268_45880 [Streptomyces sp. V2]|nr:hypothetical protein DF268_45880 [Streptomyces sp. V2]